MSEYKRLTEKDSCYYDDMERIDDLGGADILYDRLAELEDKIESSELCDRKTCKNITDKNPVDEFVCSSCGFIIDDFSRVKVDDDGEVFHYEYEIKYCPNCGAKVEDEE